MRHAAVLLASLALVNCGGGGGSTPTSPTTTTTTTPTRIIGITGGLVFGSVNVGSTRSLSFTISNTGNSTLTVTSLGSSPAFVQQSSVSFTSGTIPAGGSQTVTVTFQPTTAGTYSGTLTVNADQTSGTNTLPFSAEGVAPSPFTGNWTGSYIVERCDGSGSLQDLFCSSPVPGRAGGIFPIGTALPVTINLSQSGNNVTGTLSLGQVTGPVTGTISNNVLTLQGTLNFSTSTVAILLWNSTVSGSSMSGTSTYNVSIAGVPGVLLMTTRLSSVTK